MTSQRRGIVRYEVMERYYRVLVEFTDIGLCLSRRVDESREG